MPAPRQHSSPSVAVVIVTYNFGQYLDEALRSVLAQTYPPAEVVVVDDESTNETRQLVASVPQRYPGVRAILSEHAGQARTRNVGIRATTSDLVLCLDGDDMLLPTCLEQAVAAFAEHPEADLVYGWTEKFGAESGVQQYRPWDVAATINNNFIQPSAFVFRRSLFERTAGWGEVLTRAGGYDDWDFTVTAAEVGAVGYVVPQVWARWRRHAGNDFPRMMQKFAACRRLIYQRHYWFFSERWPGIVGELVRGLPPAQLRYELEFGAADSVVRTLEEQVRQLRSAIDAAVAQVTAREEVERVAADHEREKTLLRSEIQQLTRLLTHHAVHK